VFVSTDEGLSWSELGSGLPNTPIVDVKTYINGGVKKLRAASYGRGLWQLDLPQIGLSFSQNSLNLVTVVGTSQSRIVTITNNSASTVNISGIGVSSGYVLTNNCPAALTAGAQCSVNVAYTPSGFGLAAGTLTVNSDAPDAPHVVQLNGAGVDYSVAVVRPTRPTRNSASNPGAVVAGANIGFSTSAAMAVPSGTGSPTSMPVNFECSGAPRGAQCVVSPHSADLAYGPVTVNVTVQTSSGGKARRLSGSGAAATPKGNHTVLLRAFSGSAVRSVVFSFEVR